MTITPMISYIECAHEVVEARKLKIFTAGQQARGTGQADISMATECSLLKNSLLISGG